VADNQREGTKRRENEGLVRELAEGKKSVIDSVIEGFRERQYGSGGEAKGGG
jgi:hypothetical protein